MMRGKWSDPAHQFVFQTNQNQISLCEMIQDTTIGQSDWIIAGGIRSSMSLQSTFLSYNVFFFAVQTCWCVDGGRGGYCVNLQKKFYFSICDTKHFNHWLKKMLFVYPPPPPLWFRYLTRNRCLSQSILVIVTAHSHAPVFFADCALVFLQGLAHLMMGDQGMGSVPFPLLLPSFLLVLIAALHFSLQNPGRCFKAVFGCKINWCFNFISHLSLFLFLSVTLPLFSFFLFLYHNGNQKKKSVFH